jgi:uncharacterized protein YbjT (DUF2867 family)
VILTLEPPRNGSTGDRLLRALERRGHAVGSKDAAPEAAPTVLVGPAPGGSVSELRAWLDQRAPAPDARLLVLTRLGTHPDARNARLRECWALEEAARASGLPVLTLRLGPLLGPESPLWLRLRSGPRLPRRGEQLLNPVAEADVVEALDRALSGRAEWRGWYEVAGPEVWSLAELCALARESGPPLAKGSGAWEPPLKEMEEHRFAEASPWLAHFSLSVRPLAEQARAWRAVEERSTA